MIPRCNIDACACACLDQFAENHSLYVGPGDVRPVTHLDMSGHQGGKLHVPPECEAHFLRVYWKDLDSGRKKAYLIEHMTPVFPMFVDIDIRTSDLDWRACVVTMQRHLRVLFPEIEDDEARKRFMVVATGTTPSDTTGLNVHFPNLLVDTDQAKSLRAAAVEAMALAHPELSGLLQDTGVPSGLRMLGSWKVIACPACKGQPIQSCKDCKGHRKQCVDRRYSVLLALDGLGIPDHTIDLESAFRLTSVRRPGAVADEFTCPPSPRKRNAAQDVHHKGAGKPKAVVLGQDQINMLLRVFRRALPDKYAELQIQDVVRCGESELRVHVKGTGSHWCGNVNRCHASSRIFFAVKPEGVQQRCFCQKSWPEGPCASYRPAIVPFEGAECARLYGYEVGRRFYTPAEPTEPKTFMSSGRDITVQLLRNATVLAPGPAHPRLARPRHKSLLLKWAERQ